LNNKLLKQQVISGKKEISYLFGSGIRVKGSFFKVIYKKNPFSFDRVAVIVSKKNGNAICRNRIKRIVRETIRTNWISTPPYYDILIQPDPNSKSDTRVLKSALISWYKESKKEFCQ
jgi:ribonuclease P protein component